MTKAVRYSAISASWLCVTLGTALTSAVQAQEQRWFEVEMLVFSQTPSATLQEQFSDTVTPIKPGRAYDLLTARYQPQLDALLSELPLCLPAAAAQPDSPPVAFTMPRSLCIIEPQPYSWQHSSLFEPRRINNKVPYPAQIDYAVSGSGQHQTGPYLAEDSALQLGDIASKIKRLPGTTLLLHTAWRQAPVTERRAIASRWFAGQNFSQQFDYWGQPLTPVSGTDIASPQSETPLPAPQPDTADELLSSIELLLQQLNANSRLPDSSNTALDSISSNSLLTPGQLPDQVWQLDGLFKLHLDHYLFVNTEFNLRLPTAGQLKTVYVRQSRRVISGEIHYLDHPYLGIVLQIRRFEPPQPEVIDDTAHKLLTE